MKEPKEKNTPNNSSPSLSPTPSAPIPIPPSVKDSLLNFESPEEAQDKWDEIPLDDELKKPEQSSPDSLTKIQNVFRTISTPVMQRLRGGDKKKNAKSLSNSPTTNNPLRFSLSDIRNLFSNDSELPDSNHPNINSSLLKASRKSRGSEDSSSSNSPDNENLRVNSSPSIGSGRNSNLSSSPLAISHSTSYSTLSDTPFMQEAKLTEEEELRVSLEQPPPSSYPSEGANNLTPSPNSTVTQSTSTAFSSSSNENEPEIFLSPRNVKKKDQQRRPNKRSKPSSSWPSFSHKFDTYVDSGAIKVAESSPKYIEAISCAFASVFLVCAYFDERINLGVGWSYINAANSFLIGISQLSDERKHRRTMRKLKGMTNLANAAQLAASPGIPALAASFGLSFIHSLEELQRCWKRWDNPQYWYEDAKSERALLQEQLTRLRSIERNTTTKSGFFYNQLQAEISKVNTRKSTLDTYIDIYINSSSNNVSLHPDAKLECYKDLIKALLNTITQGIAFASMVMACIMPITEPPVYLCIIAVVAMTAAKEMDWIELAQKVTEVIVGENVAPVTSPLPA